MPSQEFVVHVYIVIDYRLYSRFQVLYRKESNVYCGITQFLNSVK